MSNTESNYLKGKIWLPIGVASLALLLGLLTGASHSPMAGVTVTSLFGILTVYLSLKEKRGNNEQSFLSKITEQHLSFAGIVLTVFSVVFIIGVFAGVEYKHYKSINSCFAWGQNPAPKTIEEALDWVVIHDKLTHQGYSDEFIHNLYKIRMLEQNDTSLTEYEKGYHSSYNDILKGVDENYLGPNIAVKNDLFTSKKIEEEI